MVVQPRMGVLTECAARYACAVGAPFSSNAIGACFPSFPARPSRKVHSRLTGVFKVGSQVGYIAIAPTACNDLASIYYTETAYAGANLSVGATGVTVSNNTANPYGHSLFLPGNASADCISARIISVGLRIRYTGTELNKGGLIYGLVLPNHGNLHSTTPVAMSAWRECVRRPVSRAWTTIVASAIDTDEGDYPDVSELYAINTTSSLNEAVIKALYPFSSGNSVTTTNANLGGIPMAFMITSTEGNSFEFEVITHMEIIGSLVQNSVTPSHADAIGLSKIIEVKGMADINAASNTSNIPYEKNFAESLKSGISQMVDTTVEVASVAKTINDGVNKLSQAYASIPWALYNR